MDVNKNNKVCLIEEMSLTEVPGTANTWIDDLYLLQEDQQIILSPTAWIKVTVNRTMRHLHIIFKITQLRCTSVMLSCLGTVTCRKHSFINIQSCTQFG